MGRAKRNFERKTKRASREDGKVTLKNLRVNFAQKTKAKRKMGIAKRKWECYIKDLEEQKRKERKLMSNTE